MSRKKPAASLALPGFEDAAPVKKKVQKKPKKKKRAEEEPTVATKIHRTRDGRIKPAKCDQYMHAHGCHPARPLCWRMRLVKKEKYGVCECGMPIWPHRRGHCEDKQKKLFAEEEDYLRELAEWEAHKQATYEQAERLALQNAPPDEQESQAEENGEDYPF